MKLHILKIWACCLIIVAVGCNRDIDESTEIKQDVFIPTIVEEQIGNMVGVVYDEKGAPVEGASVVWYSGSTTTDQYGAFNVDNVRLDALGTYVTAKKNGYSFGSDMIYPTKGTSYVSIQVFNHRKTNSFEGKDGGTISMSNGSEVKIRPGSIIDSEGRAYEGKVYYTAEYLDPAASIEDIMPGELRASDHEGRIVSLGSAGMILVDLYDNAGKKLNINSDMPANVKIPANNPEYPEQIQTWSFDEFRGLWKEEGVATLADGFYRFEATHFSFWNCDAPFPLVKVSGRVIDQDGKQVSILVRVKAEPYICRAGLTNSDGTFCGLMPKGKELTFCIVGNCGKVVKTITAGPFDTNTDLGDIIIQTGMSQVSGTVVCQGVAVPEALIVLTKDERKYIIAADSSGNYNWAFLCPEDFDAEIFAYNPDTYEASTTEVISIVANAPTIHDIDICASGCDFAISFDHDCTYEYLDITLSNTAPAQTFTYLWSTGETTQRLEIDSILFNNMYCVTVTDQSSCSKIACITPGYSLQVYPFQSDCASIGMEIGGGVPPIQVDLSGPESGSVTTEQGWAEFTVTTTGVYTVTATDANGCQSVETIDFEFQDLSIDEANITCNFNEYLLPVNGDATSWSYISSNIFLQGQTFPISINVLNIDSFDFYINLRSNSCSGTVRVKLPYFEGVSVAGLVFPSCNTCEDGRILIDTDTSANCRDCTFGEIKVLDINDNDVTAQNNAGTLKKGIYNVIAIEQNTGCVIYAKKVTL